MASFLFAAVKRTNPTDSTAYCRRKDSRNNTIRRMLLDLHAPRLCRYLPDIFKYKKTRPAEKFPLVAVGNMIPTLLIGQA
jgi:hypothetical protein